MLLINQNSHQASSGSSVSSLQLSNKIFISSFPQDETLAMQPSRDDTITTVPTSSEDEPVKAARNEKYGEVVSTLNSSFVGSAKIIFLFEILIVNKD